MACCVPKMSELGVGTRVGVRMLCIPLRCAASTGASTGGLCLPCCSHLASEPRA